MHKHVQTVQGTAERSKAPLASGIELGHSEPEHYIQSRCWDFGDWKGLKDAFSLPSVALSSAIKHCYVI